MTQLIANHINNSLYHLYISPLEQCNLHCKMCYTSKTKAQLTGSQILDFIHRYSQEIKPQTITFCGGEVFLMTDFISTVNNLTHQGFFVQIITNGTINKLAEFSHPNLINLIVSLDGLPQYHDQNRGSNRWQQSVTFMKSGLQLGFHIEAFSIVTAENFSQIDLFENRLQAELGCPISVTYHPRKPPQYLALHPVSNQVGETDGFSFITPRQRQQLGKHHQIFPPRELGCYQPSLMSDGKIYGCCEGIHPLGTIKTNIKQLISVFNRKINHRLGCIEPDFMCGLKSRCPKGDLCH